MYKEQLASIDTTLKAILASLTRLEIAETFVAGQRYDAQQAAKAASAQHGAAADASAKHPLYESEWPANGP